MQKTLDRLSHIITVPASHTCKITVQCCILRAYLRWRHIYETRTGWRLENAYCVLPTWSLRIPSVSLQHCPHALDDDLHQRLFFLRRHTRNPVQFNNHVFYYDTPTTEIYTLSLHDALPI